MNLPFVDLKGNRIQAAKAFAEQFSEFEWQYLCSYQWFLTAVDQALATGDFFPLNVRAERTLVDERIRPRWKASKDLCPLSFLAHLNIMTEGDGKLSAG